MHRIPKIFIIHKKGGSNAGCGAGAMDSKLTGLNGSAKLKPKTKPRLQRQNASKNVDYELPSTSSLSSEDSSPAYSTPSLDACSLAKQTSFRIEGSEGELEILCKSLGFSGPEDFAIPTAAWEAMKVRSSSDKLGRLSRIHDTSSPSDTRVIDRKTGDNQLEISLEGTSADSPRVGDRTSPEIDGFDFKILDSSTSCPRVTDVSKRKIERLDFMFSDATAAPDRCNDVTSKKIDANAFGFSESVQSGCDGIFSNDKIIDGGGGSDNVVSRLSDRLGDSVRVSDVILSEPDTRLTDVLLNGSVGAKVLGCNGIKGVRPPPLAPPPAMSLPVLDSSSSTWDIFWAFAPEDARTSPRLEVRDTVSCEDEEGEKRDEGEEEEAHYVMTRRRIGRESGLPSESCSFTTSNDDDSSSTTTEAMSNISPNGKFRRIITYWEKGELIGRGSFGSVYEGMDDGGFFFAVKEVSLLDQGEEGRQSIYQLEQEISLLSQFEHENIVQYYGTEKDESKLYIFLELVTKGSLLSLYQKYNLRDSRVSAYTRQILHGLKYLHDKNVIHRDIKCANILVDANGSVKLADFGLAKVTKRNDVKSCKGTALWMAPEVVNRRNQGYGLAADIWSLGCTVLEMLTRQVPYSHLENQMQALFRIGRGERPPVPESLSQDARDFILKCLQVDPNSRPTAAQLLDHPFVKNSLPCSGSASPYHPCRRL